MGDQLAGSAAQFYIQLECKSDKFICTVGVRTRLRPRLGSHGPKLNTEVEPDQLAESGRLIGRSAAQCQVLI